ncbi:MAG: gamma-glutamyltransferase [Planctomycetota bacterium]
MPTADRRLFLATGPALGSLPLASSLSRAQDSSSHSTKSARTGRSKKGVVATVHPIASRAAIEAFRRGGNAIDAAASASIMLTVVDGFNSGIGGGCLAMVRTADGKTLALDGREKAPSLAKPEMFFRDGKPDPKLSQVGPLAAGVPGLLAALDRLTSKHGRLTLADAFAGAAEVALQGFVLDENYVRRLRSVAKALKRFPGSAEVLLDSAGNPWQAGHQLVQKDLASTLSRLSKEGVDWFYQGEFAKTASQHLTEQGGVMQASDFAEYNTVLREPISSHYRGNQVFGFPPPSSGGIHIAQMLGMLSGFNVKETFAKSEATGRHLLLEVMKRAMADRAYWLGDSDFAKVPRGLLDPSYLRERAANIKLDKTSNIASHGQPPRADIDLFGKGGHTTHLTTADADGNVVAITQTVNTTFGNKMIVPGTGVVLNNELDDFSIAPGVRNAFGLLGSEANLIAPGKRPLSSMSPTIVLDQSGAPILSCGAAGGPKIITTVLQVLVRVLDLGQSIDEAISAARAHHQWSPDTAVCENAIKDEVVEQLALFGHNVSRIRSAAVSQGLAIQDGVIEAASDPRVPSSVQIL